MRLESMLELAGLIGEAEGWEPLRDLQVEGLAYDSRRVRPGDLFVAVRGERADGHHYLEEALEAGAVGAVVEHPVDMGLPQVQLKETRRGMGLLAAAFYGNPGDKLFMVGITGTNGKTTTGYLVRSLFNSSGAGVGLIGTVSYLVGGERRDAPFTTPESVDLQALLAEMISAGESTAVLEVSSHALALGRVEGAAFDVAAFTNLGRDHLDFHNSMEDYLAVKTTLFTRHRKEGAPAVINIDDPTGARLAREMEGPVITAGLADGTDVTAGSIEVGPQGLCFELRYGGASTPVESPLLGAFNIQNLLVAAAVGFAAGLPVSETARALSGVGTVEGRMERLPGPEGVEILLDYAHKPEALRAALQASRDVAAGRVIVVFGCGGDRDRGKRPLMGRIAALGADKVIVTSDNPRTEDPDRIIEEIVAGIPEEAEYVVEPDRRTAISMSIAEASQGDVILIAGKGHERYQIVGSDRIPFDEREIVARAVVENAGGDRP